MELRGMKSMKSFGRIDNRKLGNFLIISCTILSLCLLSLVKARYCPAPNYVLAVRSQAALKLRVPEKNDVKMMADENGEDSSTQEDEDDNEERKPKTDKSKPICYKTSRRSDTCEAEGDIRIQPSSKTVFISSSLSSEELKIKPYTRKHDPSALAHVQQWSLMPFSYAKPPPQCTKNLTSPALIFSIGGFTGNLFHDFTDVLIPVFLTSRRFNGEVHFLVSDTKPWWLGRFSKILRQISNHDIIDSNAQEQANTILCFPKVVIGPTFHKELGIDATKSSTSMSDFKELLRKAFKLERAKVSNTTKPRLLIISRKKSRAFLNERGIVAMASTLGFDVRVGEPDINTDMSKFARLVNSADVLISVHGAGLTNMVYLPSNAVVIQVIPLGGLEWIARSTFKEPAVDMGVKYMDYVIKEEESSLIELYPRDDPVIKDPASVHRQGWGALRDVYLDKQNVRPHLGRLRITLLEALKLLPRGT